MRLPWGGLEAEAVGRWDQLSADVREHGGTAIVSHEILATASRTQAGRALESLGHGSGTEVHLILSVRDLVRQIPAEWQENVKHRATLSYGAFLDQIQDPARASRVASWFWSAQELPDILDRWGHDLPPEQIHLVTVPPAGVPSELLWKRFSVDLRSRRPRPGPAGRADQPSLGVPETTLVRRINEAANHELPPADLPPAGARAAGPPDAVSADGFAAGSPCRPTCTRGSPSSPTRGSRRSSAAATTWSATSRDLVGAATGRAVRRPRPAR